MVIDHLNFVSLSNNEPIIISGFKNKLFKYFNKC